MIVFLLIMLGFKNASAQTSVNSPNLGSCYSFAKTTSSNNHCSDIPDSDSPIFNLSCEDGSQLQVDFSRPDDLILNHISDFDYSSIKQKPKHAIIYKFNSSCEPTAVLISINKERRLSDIPGDVVKLKGTITVNAESCSIAPDNNAVRTPLIDSFTKFCKTRDGQSLPKICQSSTNGIPNEDCRTMIRDVATPAQPQKSRANPTAL